MICRTGQAEVNRQNGTGNTGQAERDSSTRQVEHETKKVINRTGQTSRTCRTKQAEQDRQNGTGRAGQA